MDQKHKEADKNHKTHEAAGKTAPATKEYVDSLGQSNPADSFQRKTIEEVGKINKENAEKAEKAENPG